MPNPRQPRQQFDAESLSALATSIQAAGVMQPIVVRPHPSGAPGRFELVAGERRWRAVQKLGLPTIPAVVREIDDRTAAEWALIENLQREDLNPIDRAAAFQRLIDEFELSHQQLAERVGLERATVSNLLRLNDLDSYCADCVRSGRLSLGHAKALLSCGDAGRRAALAAAAVRQGWTVRRLEQAARVSRGHSGKGGAGALPARSASPAALHREDLARRVGEQLGTRVHIETGRSKGAGRLVIEFYSLDQFEGLLRRMGVTCDDQADA